MIDGVRWTAHERVEVGHEHRTLRLDLEPETRAKLVLLVIDPSGAPIEDWEVSFIDTATGIVGGSGRMRKPVVALAPGTWTASVEPRGETYVMPFHVEVHVTADQGSSSVSTANEIVRLLAGSPFQMLSNTSWPGSRPQTARAGPLEPASSIRSSAGHITTCLRGAT